MFTLFIGAVALLIVGVLGGIFFAQNELQEV
jgi:uncharacterized protein YneF (UPF0154 family)